MIGLNSTAEMYAVAVSFVSEDFLEARWDLHPIVEKPTNRRSNVAKNKERLVLVNCLSEGSTRKEIPNIDTLLSISISAYRPPKFRLFVLGNKWKTWESLLRAYPKSQALALPLHQDKQLELAHVVRYCNRIQYTQRGRFGCVSSDEDSNLRDLRLWR